MIKFLKRYFGSRITSRYFISEDIDDIESDVIGIMSDDKFIVDLNIVVLAYVLLSKFEPEIAGFIHSLRVLNLTPQEFAIVMLRVGTTFQFLGENQNIALEKADEADFSQFSEESVALIRKTVIELRNQLIQSVSEEASDDLIGLKRKPKELSPDELANKLIDDYLKKNKDKNKNKDDNS